MRVFVIISFFICCACLNSSFGQDSTVHGTIRVQKKGNLVKVQYDNVNFRLVGIDQYGNVLDSAVLEFEIAVTIQGIFHKEKTNGPLLSNAMQQRLDRADQTTKIFFDKIKAKNRDGTLIDMPKFQYTQNFRGESPE